MAKEKKEDIKQEKKVDKKKTEKLKNLETEDVEVINPLEKENESLRAENAKLKEQVATLKNDYARAFADTENTRRRLNQEAEQTRKYRIQSFAVEVLPVIDNLERALAQEVTNEETIKFRKGIEMTHAQLLNALKNEGVEEIDVIDKPFDANNAQAIMTEKVEGVEPGIVTAVLQKGYMLKDRVLRASMVKVSE